MPHDVGYLPVLNESRKVKHRLRVRLGDLLFGHLRESDDGAPDDELLRLVMTRYLQSRRG